MTTNIFWDYSSIDTSSEVGMIASLKRKIMFGVFSDGDIVNICQYFDRIDMADYWKHYFELYFKKYGTHADASPVSRLDR